MISQAIEIFLLACSDQNHRVRSSASENLKRLVKVIGLYASMRGGVCLVSSLIVQVIWCHEGRACLPCIITDIVQVVHGVVKGRGVALYCHMA